jgi:hypothetical protein
LERFSVDAALMRQAGALGWRLQRRFRAGGGAAGLLDPRCLRCVSIVSTSGTEILRYEARDDQPG